MSESIFLSMSHYDRVSDFVKIQIRFRIHLQIGTSSKSDPPPNRTHLQIGSTSKSDPPPNRAQLQIGSGSILDPHTIVMQIPCRFRS